MRTMRLSVAVAVLSGSVVATPATAVDTTLPGIKLKVSDSTQPSGARRKIVVVAKDAGIVIPPEGGAGDPTLNGGILELANTAGSGESDTIALPAGNWLRLPGNPANPLKGWRYKEVVSSQPDDDYKIKVTIKQGYSSSVLRAVVKDDRGSKIFYTLDEASQGSLGVRVATGADRHCLDFGGLIVADESVDLGGSVYRGRFVAKAAPAPADCGSPSGAFVD